jgi:hypothetical protein
MNKAPLKKHIIALVRRLETGFVWVLAWLSVPVSTSLAQPLLQFSNNSYSVAESAGSVTLTVQRLSELAPAVRVDYATTNLTAVAGSKYMAVSGTLTFNAGETNKNILVPVLNNGFVDGTRTFRVILSNPTSGAVLGTPTEATVSIADNDFGIQFRFASYSVFEAAGTIRIGVVRDDDGELPVTVDYATSELTAKDGIDYAGCTNTLAFGPTERLKFFTIPILNNDVAQTNRSFQVRLSNPNGGSLGQTRTTTVTIRDNDQGVRFESSGYTVSEDAGAALIRVLRGTDATNSPMTVDFATTDVTATNGRDYTALSGTLAFGPGETSKLIAVPILNDGLKGSTKTLRVTLSNPTGGTALGSLATTTVTVLDNDPGVGFELANYPVWAQARNITLTVVRGNDGGLQPFSVDYASADGTALAGREYQPVSGTLTFQENETVKDL